MRKQNGHCNAPFQPILYLPPLHHDRQSIQVYCVRQVSIGHVPFFSGSIPCNTTYPAPPIIPPIMPMSLCPWAAPTAGINTAHPTPPMAPRKMDPIPLLKKKNSQSKSHSAGVIHRNSHIHPTYLVMPSPKCFGCVAPRISWISALASSSSLLVSPLFDMFLFGTRVLPVYNNVNP